MPRSFASLGAERGSPEAREVYLQSPRRETRCCSSLARSCSVQAAHHRVEKSLFVCVKWAEKSGTLVPSRRLDSSSVAVGPMSCSQGQGPPSPPRVVCPLPPGPKPWLSIPTGVYQGPPVPPSPHHTAMASAATCTAQLGFPMAPEHHCPLLHAQTVALGTAARPACPWACATSPRSWRKIRGNVRAREFVIHGNKPMSL